MFLVWYLFAFRHFRSGKTSIERVVFHKMSPHETLFLESTQDVDIHTNNNNFIRFQTWDFGGDLSLMNDVIYLGKKIPVEKIFRNCTTLIYVVDAQEDDFEDSLPKLVETIAVAHRYNPAINFEVFLVCNKQIYVYIYLEIIVMFMFIHVSYISII